ncbi:ATP-binding protein [Clostridium botulinum]|uniref:ATP-binding protein n=1 Tax=Clostridium botulinum TaxID=1491 RepID=A0A6M0SL73_CLOBO|nr:ATP-binding protein [Clostridium botulinum]
MSIAMAKKPFGRIMSISGIEIMITIDEDIYKNKLEQKITIGSDVIKLYVGTVGDIFLIGDPELKDIVHYAIFEEVKLVTDINDENKNKAIIVAKVIGYQDKTNKELCFRRGVGHYPRFDSECYLLSPEEKSKLFHIDSDNGTVIGTVSGINNETISIDTNKFLNKHSVILGSTGSGKSCTVASIMQKVLMQHLYSHIIFFDLHNEYSSAFIGEDVGYKVNTITDMNFRLPYWLLNFDEFIYIFLGDNGENQNSDGIRILKDAILELKRKEHELIEAETGRIERININSPLKYSIYDLVQKLEHINESTIWVSDNSEAIDQKTGKYIKPQGNRNIKRVVDGDTKDDKVNKLEGYYGKCTQIIQRIQSIINDRRYKFLFDDKFDKSTKLYSYLEELLCIKKDGEEQKQMSILDLSTIPSEIMPTIIGVISRICFEYKVWDRKVDKVPLYLIFEESQNYIPKEKSNLTKFSINSISKIAKEGRKYGISQLIISQRPSDLCDSIISQCSNFFILRVTNPNDQNFIKNVMPDHLASLTNMIPFFENGECLVAGECVRIPSKVVIDEPKPRPNSNDVNFSKVWREELKEYSVSEAVNNWWEIENE